MLITLNSLEVRQAIIAYLQSKGIDISQDIVIKLKRKSSTDETLGSITITRRQV